MGSLEIALLGMACAIFFGALIALVTICSIKYKRYVGNYSVIITEIITLDGNKVFSQVRSNLRFLY